MKKLAILSIVFACFFFALLLSDGWAGYPLEFEKLRFFESGSGLVDYNQRVYATSFPRSTTRFINCEATFENILYDMIDQSHRFSFKYYDAYGNFKGEAAFDTTISFKSKGAWVSHGWGWKDPGNWPAGKYTVKVFVENWYMGQDSFTIYEDRPTPAYNDPFVTGKNIALTGRVELNGEVWVKCSSSEYFKLAYDVKSNWVIFAENQNGTEIMWVKKFNNNTYFKSQTVNGKQHLVQITREEAEREARRILQYFTY